MAKVGLALAVSVKQVTSVWPPSGLALAVLLLGGYRLAPAVWLGAFAANLVTNETALTAAGIALGNTAGPLLAAIVLRRLKVDARLERASDVLLLATIGCIAMFVTATNGVLWLIAAGAVPWQGFGSAWRLWWNGDAMGVVLFAPLFLTWLTADRENRRPLGSTPELLAFVPAMLFVAWLGFLNNLRLGFLIFPLIVWSALRFSQRITSVAVVVVTAFAIAGAQVARGPFAFFGKPDQRFAYAMTVMAVLAITGLIFGAMTAERDNAEESRRALERRELEHATEIARILQSAFLPKRLPEHPDLTFDAVYLTAENKELIGGDWYDAFAIPDGQIVISIGDMMGHGVTAAVIAAEIRQRILASAFTSADPGEILTKVNATLGDHPQMLATALVAVIDPAARRMCYASAGHPPAIVAGPDVAPRLLDYGGLPLGVLSHAEYDSTFVVLEPEAIVVFYTDGITEIARDLGSGERALVEAVQYIARNRAVAGPAEALRSRVMGERQAVDDAVLMLVRLASPIAPSGEERERLELGALNRIE